MLERFADEMDRMFEDFGIGRRMFSSPSWRAVSGSWIPVRDGVLEITMPAPPEQVTRGRRLEIGEGARK